MRVVGYVRVSTEEQATGGVSLAAQCDKVKSYARLYDLELIETIEDYGLSAKTLARPGLQRALTMLAKGHADGLLVCKLDRLSRSVADWSLLIDRYFSERGGRQLFSVGDSIDTRTAAGRLVLNILMSVAAWEREAIGERTRDALRHKIHQGQRVGRIRYGYDLGSDGKTLVPNAHEQAAIEQMLTLRKQGWTLRRIAAELTARGVPTKDGGRNWTHTAIARIIGRQSEQNGAGIIAG